MSSKILWCHQKKPKFPVYHNRALKIINISNIEAATKFNIPTIETLTDKTCAKLLIKIINGPLYPVITKLLVNPRSTLITNQYKSKTARKEAHNQSFIPKYLRLLRDESSHLYQNKPIKILQPARTNNKNNNKIIQ